MSPTWIPSPSKKGVCHAMIPTFKKMAIVAIVEQPPFLPSTLGCYYYSTCSSVPPPAGCLGERANTWVLPSPSCRSSSHRCRVLRLPCALPPLLLPCGPFCYRPGERPRLRQPLVEQSDEPGLRRPIRGRRLRAAAGQCERRQSKASKLERVHVGRQRERQRARRCWCWRQQRCHARAHRH